MLSLFSSIKNADAQKLLPLHTWRDTAIILNPPFGSVQAPRSCNWAQGATSRAALFAESAMKSLAPGSYLVAILPDVLRSGSNYRKWRTTVESVLDIKAIQPLGIFDKHTDVDVFLLVAQADKPSPSAATYEWWPTAPAPLGTVGDRFEVRVGTVVDNRDPRSGAEHPFLVAKDLPSSGIVSSAGRSRRFSGRLFEPPFVVIRRTSRPTSSSNVRAGAVVVSGKVPVAVDNHLIVAIPIRCRHLTVGVIRDLPWR